METIQTISQTLNVYAQNGQFTELLALTERYIRENPNTALLYIYKGDALKGLERNDEALEAYRTAIILDPNDGLARSDYAALLYQMGDFVNALNASDAAIFMDPRFADPYLISADILSRWGYLDQAVFAYHRAFMMDESNIGLGGHVALLYTSQMMPQEAMEVYFKLAALDTNNEALQLKIGTALLFFLQNGIDHKTIASFAQEWLKVAPNSRIAALIASELIANNAGYNPLTGENIAAVFDQYAADYDALRAEEGYTLPALIESTMGAIYGVKTDLTILDVGCGTGLCGAAVKPYAKVEGLAGVDVSTKMLDIAYDKKIYDKIFNGDFVSYLMQTQDQYDLIVAGDVLPYSADLDKAFAAFKHALKEKGRVILTIRKNGVNTDDKMLYPPFYELYSEKYIEHLLKENDFAVQTKTPLDENNENAADSEVLFVVQRKT